mmetsp:Transcript_39674/g.92863  ORF Transcript_39674/g.92863 Transcript_39674/m.92863 type:complete len:88 (-) Transcript_39674:489-752(-)
MKDFVMNQEKDKIYILTLAIAIRLASLSASIRSIALRVPSFVFPGPEENKLGDLRAGDLPPCLDREEVVIGGYGDIGSSYRARHCRR